METRILKLMELFVLFVMLPVSFCFKMPIWIKLIMGILAFIYVLVVLLRVEKVAFKVRPNLSWSSFLKRILLQWLFIALLTTLYIWVFEKEHLFEVILTKPLLWLVIIMVYSCFSVYPQELIYRTFFFQRYQHLFKSERLFLILNATLFALAHSFFRNGLVTVITFVGGLLFGITYKRTKSTLMVSIEHAIYGSWLFTVGMGHMLGFPS